MAKKPKTSEGWIFSDGGSRVFTIRLDEKTRFGIEILKHQLHYRTGAKFIDDAIAAKFKEVEITTKGAGGVEAKASATAVLDAVWHPDPLERFLNVAFAYPDLLRSDELVAKLWSLLSDTNLLWLGGEYKQRADNSQVYVYETKRENLDFKLFRILWDDFLAAARGEMTREELENRVKSMVRLSFETDGVDSLTT